MDLFYTHKNPAAYIVLAVSGCIHSAKIKNVHSFQVILCLSLSGILIASMNNILQVSSRSSLVLPRRKLSNSRQVIPLCSLDRSKSYSEWFTVNEKHAKSTEETHALQSRCDCNHKLTLMPPLSRLGLCLICLFFLMSSFLFLRWMILSGTSSPHKMIPSLCLLRFSLVDV